eukprot:TRINITY_DN8697_c0_g1_i9.p3 TRINITY_DN8697_c0_g1~~TRINITY_DN8697_c0_g1_i9.p3  ORF type:complete len:147 (+),score=45.70 TRINITY_DN8697_c0_g1_i9:903-1343(+)
MIAHPLVKHALNVASAINTDNYARFFKLYRKASSFEVSAALMSQLLPKVRKKALSRIGAAYRPGVPVGLIQEQLVFGTEEDCVTFLEEEGQKVQDSQVLLGGGRVEPRASRVGMAEQVQKKKKKKSKRDKKEKVRKAESRKKKKIA